MHTHTHKEREKEMFVCVLPLDPHCEPSALAWGLEVLVPIRVAMIA